MKHLILISTLLLTTFTAGALTADAGRERIHDQPEQVNPLLPGMQAPAFEVLDATGQPVTFDPGKMTRPLVLTFFRGGWCPFCNLHLAELRKAESALSDMGFDNWFISIDKPEMLYASLEQPDTTYQLFSDSSLEATRAFGIAFKMPDELVEKYLGYGIDVEAASGEEHHVLPAPSTFIIGRDGIINFQYTNPDYAVRLHPDVLLSAARVYQQGVDGRLRRQYEARKKKHD